MLEPAIMTADLTHAGYPEQENMKLTGLTEGQSRELRELSELPNFRTRYPSNGAAYLACHSLVKLGLAQYHYNDPVAFSITKAGRLLLTQKERT